MTRIKEPNGSSRLRAPEPATIAGAKTKNLWVATRPPHCFLMEVYIET